jgi:HSP20 family protein
MSKRDLDEWLWQVGAELQRISEELSPGAPLVARHGGWEPRVDIFESESEVVVRAELAGMRGDDIRLQIGAGGQTLILRGTRHEDPHARPMKGVHQLEIFFGEFEREIALPTQDIDFEDIEAEYRNGFLLVHLPKASARPTSILRRTVVIKKL